MPECTGETVEKSRAKSPALSRCCRPTRARGVAGPSTAYVAASGCRSLSRTASRGVYESPYNIKMSNAMITWVAADGIYELNTKEGHSGHDRDSQIGHRSQSLALGRVARLAKAGARMLAVGWAAEAAGMHSHPRRRASRCDSNRVFLEETDAVEPFRMASIDVTI